MKISVITINYNNKNGLFNTINSIKEQIIWPYEYIVIDGGSDDDSLDLIKLNSEVISKWLSEKDSGIYEAMNKGVRLATGDYCIFMNSGDTFYSANVLKQLIEFNHTEDYILGGVISGQVGYIKAKKNLTMIDFVFGSIAHQASIIKRTLLLSNPYDEHLKIVSDWKFCIDVLVFKNCSYKAIDLIIAIEEPGGLSSGVSKSHAIERRSVLNQFLPAGVLADYTLIRIFNKKPLKWFLSYLQ